MVDNNQFVKVQNFSNWTTDKQADVNTKGQIAFVCGDDHVDENGAKVADVNYLYAQGKSFGDGAMSDKTILTEEITIEGGPLASAAVKNAFTGGKIPAGTDLQELLKALLCVELWPASKPNPTTGSANITQGAATVTLSKTLVEVGSSVTVKVRPVRSGVSKTNSSITNFTYGYKQGATAEAAQSATKNSNTSVSVVPFTYLNNDNYKMAYTVNYPGNVTDISYDSTQTEFTYGADTKETSFNITAYYGTTTVGSKITGESGYYTIGGISTTYACSNLGAVIDEKGVLDGGKVTSYYSSVAAVSKTNMTAKEAKTQASVVAMYPVYHNGTKYSGGNPDNTTTPSGAGKTKIDAFTPTTQQTLYIKFADVASSGHNYKLYVASQYNPTITVKGYNANTGKYDIPMTLSYNNTTVSWSDLHGSSKGDFDTVYKVYENTAGGENGQEIKIKLQ